MVPHLANNGPLPAGWQTSEELVQHPYPEHFQGDPSVISGQQRGEHPKSWEERRTVPAGSSTELPAMARYLHAGEMGDGLLEVVLLAVVRDPLKVVGELLADRTLLPFTERAQDAVASGPPETGDLTLKLVTNEMP